MCQKRSRGGWAMAVAIAASSACSSGGGADKEPPGISVGRSGGGSGGGAPSGGAGGTGTTIGDGGGSGTTVPLDGCVEETGEGASATEARSTSVYKHRRWDPALRILTEETSFEYSSTVQTLKWRYTADGRELAYVGIEQQPFQHDYRYDEHDNAVDFYLSYPSAPDLMKPSEAPAHMGTSWVHEYDGERLAASTETTYGSYERPTLRHVYTEDEKGRCVQVDTTGDEQPAQETRKYDDQDRLLRVQVEGGKAWLDYSYDYTYDSQGRVVTRDYSGPGSTINASARTTHAYLADGSETVEIYDGTTDVLSEMYAFVKRSAECRIIDAQIGHPPDARCRVPRAF